MKILVTGHRGFIGSNVYAELKRLGHDVIGYEWGEVFPGYDCDAVMHIGAISSTAERDVEAIMRQNYDFSVDLLEECSRRGIHFQFSSSASVYGCGTVFAESAPPDPRSPYAWSKYLFERYTLSKKFSAPVQCFRYFNVYGPGESHKTQPSPYEAFSRQDTIRLFEGSENIKRDFVPVQRVVRTHIEFLKVPDSGIWNCGTAQTTSFLEVAQSFNRPIEWIPMPANLAQSYQYYTCSDNTKFNSTVSKYNLVID